ncbi:MAG: hypothetical protein QNJ64_19675, partial [Crocosphaera sp.]|nr:hypothetical protein [Crocosphaera sp.]
MAKTQPITLDEPIQPETKTVELPQRKAMGILYTIKYRLGASKSPSSTSLFSKRLALLLRPMLA